MEAIDESDTPVAQVVDQMDDDDDDNDDVRCTQTTKQQPNHPPRSHRRLPPTMPRLRRNHQRRMTAKSFQKINKRPMMISLPKFEEMH